MSGARNEIGKKSLAFHRKWRGKISIVPKIPVKNRQDLSLVYTPGVGAVSSYLAKHKDEVGELTLKKNCVAVISDGSAVLGLGNLGPEGALPVMEGKAMLFKTLSGIDAFPIVLATQDTEAIIQTVKNIAPVFGGINLEDVAAPRCFEIETRLQQELDIPVMHDDQHGTAMVVLAGLLNALKVVKKKPGLAKVVISGAGAAGQAIAHLLLLAGMKRLMIVDSRGIIGPKRKDLDSHKQKLASLTNAERLDGTLEDALRDADVFIGVSKAGLLTREHVRSMRVNPIVFALANPVPEIMPDEARAGGAAVVATGRSDFPNQINNSLGFPGIFRGALDHKVTRITDEMLVRAAKNLARIVKNPTSERIVPDTFDKRVVPAVARAIRRER